MFINFKLRQKRFKNIIFANFYSRQNRELFRRARQIRNDACLHTYKSNIHFVEMNANKIKQKSKKNAKFIYNLLKFDLEEPKLDLVELIFTMQNTSLVFEIEIRALLMETFSYKFPIVPSIYSRN